MRLIIALALLILGTGCYKADEPTIYQIGKWNYTYTYCNPATGEFDLDSSFVDYGNAGKAGIENYWIDEYIRLHEQLLAADEQAAVNGDEYDEFSLWFTLNHYPTMIVNEIRIPYDYETETYLIHKYLE